jgi:hypothetical protein
MIKKLFALSLLCSLAACGPSPDGYYDEAGNFHSYTTNHSPRAPLPAGHDIVTGSNGDNYHYYDHDPYPVGNRSSTTVTRTYVYERPGYYDYNGYYVGRWAGVPRSYMPPRGMCRVWFTDRDYADEPAVESCDGIQYRVPAGAYVVYGG